jgi:WD40 repeat protein/class 3 adenylate cyclase
MLQIQLLGQFEVRADGKRITIASRPAQSLFSFLILTAGTAHRREKLAGMFWPDTSDENARKNLRQELWRIRKAISSVPQPVEMDYLLADEFTLGFNRDAEYWLDVAQLERPDLDLPALLSNLSAYQGELLPGFYEEWISLERERIQAVFEARMGQLLEQLIVAERWIALQEWSERWLSFGNTPESAYRALMLASGVRGDIAKVATIYQRCADELLEHFGIEPSAETRALYDGLRKGTHTPRSAALQTSGTITFLFTDIEGSTHLLDYLGDHYALVLATHHEILRAAIQNWNGHEVDTQGDAFFVTFNRSLDAVQCVAEAQRALAAYSWPHGRGVHVRMGLHTGEPLIASTGYVGMDVHRAARIGDAGHGGQVLLSQATRELVIHDLPLGLTIRELGEHRLKDLKYPTPIYQLVIEGLPTEFPALRTKFTGAEAPTPGEPPFKGLQYFDETDSDLFFGRELLTAKLVNRLREFASPSEGGDAAKFLSVIIGASGSGKSSLVRAGLIPALKKGQLLIDGIKPPEGSADWQVHIITPTAHPLEALATELTRASESVTAAATLMDDLIQDPRSLALFLARQTPRKHTLLVLDQFEELFTLCRDEFEREAFIDNLLTTLNQADGNITIVLTLRADFYAHLAQYPELRDAVAKQQEYIGPMTTDELRRAIEEPVKRGHWEFEAGLVDLILRDIGDEPGALPLLSHALLETWKRRAGHRLTLKGYADAGGVHGAIAHTAENVYQNLSTEEQIITRNLFLRLTELGEGTEDTRRRASFDELMSHAENAAEVRAVMNILAEARLITLGEETAEVAHEALIREWPTLREWLNRDREGLQLHRHLTETSHEWEVLDREISVLYRGSRLAQANEWTAINPLAMNSQEKTFLEASNRQSFLEEQEREAQLQRELEAAQKLAETERRSIVNLRLRNRVITAIGIVAIVMAVLASVFAVQSSSNLDAAEVANTQSAANASTAQAEAQSRATAEAIAVNERNLAEQQSLIASVRELSSEANVNLAIDPERSILLALQAVNKTYAIDRTVRPEAEDALHRAIQSSRVELTLRDNADAFLNAVFSPDGKRIAGSNASGMVKVWDAATGKEMLAIQASTEGGVGGVAFSPNGKLLATANDDMTARVWDAATGKELLTFTDHMDYVQDIAFSPDGMRLATMSLNGMVIIWEVATGTELVTMQEVGLLLPQGLAFSPDGTRLATAAIAGNIEGWVTIWDAATGEKLITIPGHKSYVRGVSFSPDGTRIVTTGDDRTARVWDVSNGRLLLALYGHTDNVQDAAFSPDGTRLATASWDRQVKIWDVTTGQELFALAGHSGFILSIAFSPDGTRVITASDDGTIRVWNVSLSREFLTVANGPEIGPPPGGKLAYSPDGTRLAVANSDPIAEVWDTTTGKLLFSLTGHTANVKRIAYNTDGTRIATASDDGTAKVWDATSGEELLTLIGHEDFVYGIAFSPDGFHLATGSFDTTAKIWDAETGKVLLNLTGHEHWLSSVAFNPDGTHLATSSFDGTVKVWNAETGKELFTLTGHTDSTTQVVFSPDGTRLATASFDGTAIVWDAESGERLLTLSGHDGSVYGIAFSPDGKYLATAGDTTAKVWNIITGDELLTLHAPNALTSVSFSPEGSQLAVASRDGTNRIYLLRVEDLMALAKQRVTRSLTTEECQQYLHLDACPVVP